MKINYLKIAILAFLLSFAVSCDQIKELATFTKCTFRMKTLTNAELAGVNIQNKSKISQFSLSDAAKVTLAYAKGSLPVSFTLNIEGKNPNTVKASMAKMEWIAYIDDVQISSGTNSERIEIAPNNGTSDIPIQISFDLKKVITKESKDAFVNFGLNLTDASNQPTRVSLKIKPTINIGGVPVTYPGYFTVTKEFGAK